MAGNPYEDGMDRNAANFVPLSPLSFLARTKDVYPDHPALIYGSRRYSWRQVYDRTARLAGALAGRGIGVGDTVAIVAANTPELFEAHFGVPMSGAVLNTVNMRLDADTIAYILDHGDAKVVITDSQFSPAVKAALAKLGSRDLLVVDIVDEQAELRPGEGERLGDLTYEELLAEGDPDFAWRMPQDEWEALALNYTSGTSGRPKGVVYHHRGSYLMSLGTVAGLEPAQPSAISLHGADVPL